MPIRMEKDSNQDNRNQNQNNPRRPQGGNLMKWLPFILLFIFKRPKLLIPVLLIGAFWYFFLGGDQMLSGQLQNTDFEGFSLGATLSEEEFDKAEVFEPLAYGSYNSIPSAVSLAQYAPQRGHQGRQGSCVGWASAYAARTILHARATGQDPNAVVFSPSYLYNQIALEGCQGAYMQNAMRAMKENGGLPFRQFRYDERSCGNYPDNNDISQGRQYRIKGYNRLTLGANNYKSDIEGMKQNLAQGAPVVIGMMVGGTFMSRMVGQDMWYPTQADYSMRGYSGHAMCVIGYDDNRDGGAFQLMNSWGEDWGNRGIAWVRYKDFERFNREAYGLYPMGSSEKFDDNKMAVEFGLLDVATQKTIALRKKDDITFQTVQPIRKGDKFKVLIANSIECYVYVFGQETDRSSYILFPYTPKHSAYCGITGTRLFPRDYSMVADDIGNKDYMSIIITKNEIDFNQLNAQINNSRQSTYAGKVREALANSRITNVDFKAGNTVAFQALRDGKNAVGMVIEIDKN